MSQTDHVAAEQLRDILEWDGDWLHKNGKTYRVILVANLEAQPEQRDEYPVQVVYQEIDENDCRTGPLWSKSPAAFLLSRTRKPHTCDLCGTTENLHRESHRRYRCDNCVPF